MHIVYTIVTMILVSPPIIYPALNSQDIKGVISEAYAEVKAMMAERLSADYSVPVCIWSEEWEYTWKKNEFVTTLGLEENDLGKLTEHLLTFNSTPSIPEFECFPMRRLATVTNPLTHMMRVPALGTAPGPDPADPGVHIQQFKGGRDGRP